MKRKRIKIKNKIYKFAIVEINGRCICDRCPYYNVVTDEFECKKFSYPSNVKIEDLDYHYSDNFSDFCGDIENYLSNNCGDSYFKKKLAKLTLIPCQGTLEENEEKNNTDRKEKT